MADGGLCGKNMMWWLDDDGTLTISGMGEMYNYFLPHHEAPWYSSRKLIRKVVLKVGVTTIGAEAFRGCKSLTEINSYFDFVTSIGEQAFRYCESLKEIRIPASVTEIGEKVFDECRRLEKIYCKRGKGFESKLREGNDAKIIYYDELCGKNMMWWLDDDGTLTISGMGEMYNYNYLFLIEAPWYFSRKLIRKVVLEVGVTSIGTNAFWCCKSLTKINIPKGVTSIGARAFDSCSSLTEIRIPESVTKIGEKVFDECTSLEKIYCKRGTGFESILCDGNNADIVYYDDKPKPAAQIQSPTPTQVKPSTPKPAPVVEELRWKVEGKTLTVGGVRVIKDYSHEHPPWLANLRDIQSIVIAEGVEKISANAFAECTHLELLTIPASVKTIGDCAFTFCHCGDRSVNGGKNVLWSLDNGVLLFKKNPAAKTDANFSLGAVSWRAVDKNVTGVKLERGIIPNKRFFDWLGGLGSDVPVLF